MGFDFEVNSPSTCCPTVVLTSRGWKNVTIIDDCDWAVRDVPTPSLNTGPTQDQSGNGKYLYIEASGCYSRKAYLFSPKFNFSTLALPFVTFYYHMYGITIATMTFEWSLDGNLWFNVWSMSGNQGNSWQLAYIDISYLGNLPQVYFRVGGKTGTSFTSDMAFDNFSVQGSGISLPITLVDFDGELNEAHTQVDFSWIVASQINNDYFTVERSVYMKEWITIATVPGAGNNNELMSYKCVDTEPLMGTSYYRLKQTDYNGEYENFYPIIIEVLESRDIINKTYNLMGQAVGEDYEGMVIKVYNDGSYIIKQQYLHISN